MCSLTNGYAESIKIVFENDVQSVAKLDYRIDAPDPYWVFDGLALDPKLRALQIPITLDAASLDTSNSYEDIEFEVFYDALENQTIKNGTKVKFSPFHKLKYSLSLDKLAELGPALTVTLLLPPEVEYKSNAALRLDINSCSGCKMSFAKEINYGNTIDEDLNSGLKNAQLAPTLVMDGVKAMQTPIHELNHSTWRLHDLQRRGDRLKIVGNDPYLLSQQFAISTSKLGGVLVELVLGEGLDKNSSSKNASTAPTTLSHIQLFYRTEQHSFTEDASTIVGLPVSNDGVEQTIFIPLDFISTQDPVAHLLTGLRLDANHISQLNKISLVDKETSAKYQPLIPSRIYQRKFQRANVLLIASTIYNKLKKDLGFVFLYTLLLILVAIGFRRAYRR